MVRRVALVIVALVLGSVLLIWVASAGEVRYWHQAPSLSDSAPQSAPQETIPPPTTLAPGRPDDSKSKLPGWIAVVVDVVVVLGVLAALVAGTIYAWRHRPRLTWRRRKDSLDFDVLPDVARSMGADAADQRAALLRGSPRNAIVECWLRLEAVVADAGLSRDIADTSTEFTARVLASYAVDPDAIEQLSALYREARFSTHSMGEQHRTAAVVALDALHDGLRAHLGRLSAVPS